MQLEDVCPDVSEVTVVGNGPLSTLDRDAINQSACVIRFNDMKTWVDGDKVDVHALRDNTMHLSGSSGAPVWPVISTRVGLAAVESESLQPIFVHETIHGQQTAPPTKVLFPRCTARRPHSNATNGPSTGAAVIDALEAHDGVQRIHVYGMNWNGPPHHVDFKHPQTVRECCTKCTLHTTERAAYLPS